MLVVAYARLVIGLLAKADRANICVRLKDCKTTGERGEEKVRPSLRPLPFSTVQFNTRVTVQKCYVAMSFTVVFIVSSSVQSIPNAAGLRDRPDP